MALLIVGLTAFVFIERRKRRDFVLDLFCDDVNYSSGHRLRNCLDRNVLNDLKRSIEDVRKQSQSLDKRLVEEIGKLNNRINDLGDNIRSGGADPEVEPSTPPTGPKTLYADSISNGWFNSVIENYNDNTVFELSLSRSTDTAAQFTVFDNAYGRVLHSPDFIEGCDKQRLTSKPVALEIEPGTAERQDNVNWQITKRAKVKLV
jgi:hypothetical protein